MEAAGLPAGSPACLSEQLRAGVGPRAQRTGVSPGGEGGRGVAKCWCVSAEGKRSEQLFVRGIF